MNIEEIRRLDQKLNDSKLLIAEPFMPNNSPFKRAVILLCQHNQEDGSLGFIINKSLKIPVNNLLASFPEIESDVLYGGPVGNDSLHYIHNVGHLLPNSIKIGDGIYWGGDFEEMRTLVMAKIITPDNIRFFLGYSGWGAGQLRDEMTNSSWMLGHLDPNYIFNSEHNETLWEKALKNEGGTLRIISEIPKDLPWN